MVPSSRRLPIGQARVGLRPAPPRLGCRRSRAIATAVLLSLATGFGCRSSQPLYDVSSSWPHKDVVIITVELDAPLDPDDYIEVARRETRAVERDGGGRELPLYAVHVEFYLRTSPDGPRSPVARVSWVGPDATYDDTSWNDVSPWARPPQVILY